MSCKSSFDIIGDYKVKEYSKADYIINGLLYSKNRYVDYSIFNKLSFYEDNTLKYIPCLKKSPGFGHYKVDKNFVFIYFESGVLKDKQIKLKIFKNQLFKIEKSNSTNVIYNLIKIK